MKITDRTIPRRAEVRTACSASRRLPSPAYRPPRTPPLRTEELVLVTREQALTAMTINCAKQMFLEDERGSSRADKYADFLLADEDVLTCPAKEIHTAKPTAACFDGEKVLSVE